MLTHSSEEDQSHSVADSRRESVDYSLSEVEHVRGASAECELLGHDVKGDTQNGAVGGDQRKEYSKGLIERRADLFQHDLDHLYQGSDD